MIVINRAEDIEILKVDSHNIYFKVSETCYCLNWHDFECFSLSSIQNDRFNHIYTHSIFRNNISNWLMSKTGKDYIALSTIDVNDIDIDYFVYRLDYYKFAITYKHCEANENREKVSQLKMEIERMENLIYEKKQEIYELSRNNTIY